MFNRVLYENSRPNGSGVMEIAEGPEEPGSPRRFVPLKRTQMRGEIVGPLASLTLIQTFGYAREQCDRVLEALYRFPLPGDAAVTGVTVRFGDVEIRAELKERQQAEQEYQEAMREGRQATLITRESPDVFTLKVAGIQPDQEIWVETAYVQMARPEGVGYSLRVPLTTAPRYVRSDEVTSRAAQGQPLLLLCDPGHRFSLDLRIQGASQAHSPTHALALEPEADGVRVRLKEEETLPDRDCVLTWLPAQETDRPTLHVALHEDTQTDQVYFLAMVAPPSSPSQEAAREAILLVDHSGSMNGAKWEAADWAVKSFLNSLTPADRFNLGLFHSTTRWFARQPVPADPQTVERAVRFLTAHHDSGGTELGVALEQALGQARASGDAARHVLILTDAQVSDDGRILRLAETEASRADRRRISVLCIDAAPNDYLAMELADRGGGVARFLTSNPSEEDISTALDQTLEDWAQPVLTDLRLEVKRPNAQAASHAVTTGSDPGWSALDMGDLPRGRTIWAAGCVSREAASDLAFRVRGGGREIAYCLMELSGANNRPALKTLFGARRVLGLEFLTRAGYDRKELNRRLIRLGYDPERSLTRGESGATVYAENVREETAEAMRDLLVRESLRYGIVCAETAFVAVRKEAGKPVEETVAVASALPSGWSEGFLGAPGSFGAAGAVTASLMAAPLLMPASPALAADRYLSIESVHSRRLWDLFAPADSDAWDVDAPEEAVSKPPIFQGVPSFSNSEAVLFDTARAEDGARMPETAHIRQLSVRIAAGSAFDPMTLDRETALLLYLDDLAAPRAKVRLADLLRQGARPLNLRRQAGQRVRLVLSDPGGKLANALGDIEVFLEW